MKGSSKGFIEIITIILPGKSSSEPELYNKFFFGVFSFFSVARTKGYKRLFRQIRRSYNCMFSFSPFLSILYTLRVLNKRISSKIITTNWFHDGAFISFYSADHKMQTERNEIFQSIREFLTQWFESNQAGLDVFTTKTNFDNYKVLKVTKHKKLFICSLLLSTRSHTQRTSINHNLLTFEQSSSSTRIHLACAFRKRFCYSWR